MSGIKFNFGGFFCRKFHMVKLATVRVGAAVSVLLALIARIDFLSINLSICVCHRKAGPLEPFLS